MIGHVVLSRWRADAPASEVHAVLDATRELKPVPGVVDARAGADFSGQSRGHTHDVVLRLRDQAALAALLPHPAHQALHERAAPLLADSLVFDFDADAPSISASNGGASATGG